MQMYTGDTHTHTHTLIGRQVAADADVPFLFLFFSFILSEAHRGPRREADKDFVMKLLVNLAAPVLSPPRHEAQNAASPPPLLLPSQLLYILIKWESVRIIVFLFISFSLPTVRVHKLQLFFFFAPLTLFSFTFTPFLLF